MKRTKGWAAALATCVLATAAVNALGEDQPMKVAAEVNQFTLDLYRSLASEKGNLFCSPYSVSTALSMVYAGAKGDTASEMAATLHFAEPQDQLHAAMSALQRQLAEYERPASEHQQPFQLRVANAVWIQTGYKLLQAYLDLLKARYEAAPNEIDIVASAEKAAATINAWVKDRTGGRIENLIDPTALRAGVKLVITNTVYFKANWQNPFKKGLTADGPFHLAGGATVPVPLMNQTESMLYAESADCQAVELGYTVPNMRCTILLPKGDVRALEKSLTHQMLASLLENLKPQETALWLPRFTARSRFELSDALGRLGMKLAFTDAADFSGITGGRDLKIASVIHQTFVNVDEEGTEAAAATAVLMAPTGMAVHAKPKEVRVDRPFVFLIRDARTGVILFIGRIEDPRGSK